MLLGIGWLGGRVVGWLVGWLDGWLGGWVVGCFFGQLCVVGIITCDMTNYSFEPQHD